MGDYCVSHIARAPVIIEIMKKAESKELTVGKDKAIVALSAGGLEAQIDALQTRQQESLTRIACLMAVVLFAGFVAMAMQAISLEVCKMVGIVASGVFFAAVHVYRQKTEKLKMAIRGQALSPNINKVDLIRRCETFEREMSAGSEPSVNPYPQLYDKVSLPEERWRELNHEVLKCLRSFDRANLQEIQQTLASRRSKADVVSLVSFFSLIASAFAFTQTVGLRFNSTPNLLVIGLGSIAFVAIIGATLVRLMDHQNLSCMELWISEIAKEEPKPKLAESLFA